MIRSTPQVNADSQLVIQPELTSGERILWAGKPNTGVVLHREDRFLIPFSLFWGGFSVFWEMGVAGDWGPISHSSPWISGMIWGIPFVLIGQYLVWGRFLYAWWLKKRTHYAVTDRRVIAIQLGSRRRVASVFLDTLPTLIKERGPKDTGTLRFADPEPAWSSRSGWGIWNPVAVEGMPTLLDIDDVDSVYRLVSHLREKSRSAKSSSSW
jgi:hypothetical protein